MTTTLKIFRAIWHSRSPKALNMNKIYVYCRSSFCTMTLPPKVDEQAGIAESPELPSWIKFSEKEGIVVSNPEDDFVLPTISYWMEHHRKLQDTKVKSESKIRCMDDTDADKVTKILKNNFESPDYVVQALNGCDVTVSESLVAQILKRFNSDWKSAYGFFIWVKSQVDFKYSPDTYNLLVESMGKSKKFDLMWEVVEEMEQTGSGYVTLDTMTKVVRRLAKAHRYEESIDAFRRFGQFGIERDVIAMNILLHALVKERGVEHAEHIFLELKNDIAPNTSSFNALIQGWCKAMQIEKAKKLMADMKTYGLNPDVITYTSFIEAYCNQKYFRKAFQALEEMQKEGCPPNVITYTVAMHALGKAKEIGEALKVYEKMKENGCVPDAPFYSSLIFILNKAGRLKDAREVFDDMPRQGIKPDTLTYTTMISSACQHSQEENALRLLHEMEESRIKPNIDTYAPLLKMCCRLKRMKVLSFLLSHMLGNDISLDLGTYTLLIHGLCRSGKLEHACLFFEEAVLKGFVPMDTTCNMLVNELDRKGMSKAKEQINQLIQQKKLIQESG